MTKTKKALIFSFVMMLALLGCTRGAKVTLQPLYSEARFQPTNQLHAGCTNSADILFSPQGQKVSKFTLVLYYDPETIEILRIVPNTQNGVTSSKIEYNTIVLEVQNPRFDSSTSMASFFQLYFKSDSAGKETIILGTGSEAIVGNKQYPLKATFDLYFAQVPECEPDIIPPNINLITPKNSTQTRIPLDQYFVFDIKDIGKGIDKSSVAVSFDGDIYTYGSTNIKRNENYLTFFPGKRIPINKKIDLHISIADQQSYGGANKTETTYTFQSATGMLFVKEISPMMFRSIVQDASKISATSQECQLLADMYTKFSTKTAIITSLIQKLGCDESLTDDILIASGSDVISDNDNKGRHTNISVFATLGWLLFVIVFALKIHYIISYKKHKKHKKLNS